MLAEGQVAWQLYRIWYEAERLHESLDYQTPRQRLATVPSPSNVRGANTLRMKTGGYS